MNHSTTIYGPNILEANAFDIYQALGRSRCFQHFANIQISRCKTFNFCLNVGRLFDPVPKTRQQNKLMTGTPKIMTSHKFCLLRCLMNRDIEHIIFIVVKVIAGVKNYYCYNDHQFHVYFMILREDKCKNHYF